MERVVNWRSTKFLQTSFVLLSATYLVATAKIDPNTYMLLVGAALGNYAYHDVKQKMVVK
jgi:hypothetical protein